MIKWKCEEWQNCEYTVDTLINPVTHWWDIHKVQALFNPKTVSDILKIVICPNGNVD